MGNIFGQRLELLRGSRTQREFADFLGIPLNSYTNWKNSDTDPQVKNVRMAATKLGVSADWLLGLTEDRTPTATINPRGPPAAFPPRGLAVAEPAPPLCEGCAYRDKVIRHLLDKLDEQKVSAVGRTEPVRKCTCAPAPGKSSLYHG